MSESEVRTLREQLAKTRAELDRQRRELEQLRFFREVAELKLEAQDASAPDRGELRALQEELAFWRQKYSVTVESLSVAVLIADYETGRFLEANRAACLLFGYSVDELKKLSGRLLSPESVHERVREMSQQINNTGRGFLPRLLLERHDGQTFYGEVRSKVFQVGDREYVVTTVRPLHTPAGPDPLELVYEMTRGAAQAVEPLAIRLHGSLSAIEAGRQVERHLEQVRGVEAELMKLARRLRQACSDVALTVETLSLRQPLEAALAQLVKRLQGDSIKVRGRHQPGLPPVDGDPAQLTRVFRTLLYEAWGRLRDVPADAREIEIGTRSDGDRILARVWYSGIGLESDEKTSLFRPFSDARSLRRAAARGIVEAHGGTLEVDEPRSGGVAFVVTLPKR